MTNRRVTVYALALGNFITGTIVLAPAGMLQELAHHFGIGLGAAAVVMSLGAVVLCICSPLMTSLTSRVDRRVLLSVTILLVSVAQVLAAMSPSWGFLLATRVAMMAAAAIFTPQAASTISLVVEPRERPAAIATAFLGWSMALAFGVPLISMLASSWGWREAYLALGALGFVTSGILALGVPRRLVGAPVSFNSWKAILGSRIFLAILLVTVLSGAAQFVVYAYIKPLLAALTAASLWRITVDLTVFGIVSIIGNVLASRLVTRLGVFKTCIMSLSAILGGMLLLCAGAGLPAVVTAALVVWGLGFASSNSMQQARLAAQAPSLTAASIALNTSSIYIGQAIGSSVSGAMVAHDHLTNIAWVGLAFMVLALATAFLSERLRSKPCRDERCPQRADATAST